MMNATNGKSKCVPLRLAFFFKPACTWTRRPVDGSSQAVLWTRCILDLASRFVDLTQTSDLNVAKFRETEEVVFYQQKKIKSSRTLLAFEAPGLHHLPAPPPLQGSITNRPLISRKCDGLVCMVEGPVWLWSLPHQGQRAPLRLISPDNTWVCRPVARWKVAFLWWTCVLASLYDFGKQLLRLLLPQSLTLSSDVYVSVFAGN